eukprot:8483213-Alexandrium_andersonii.AAC.1
MSGGLPDTPPDSILAPRALSAAALQERLRLQVHPRPRQRPQLRQRHLGPRARLALAGGRPGARVSRPPRPIRSGTEWPVALPRRP